MFKDLQIENPFGDDAKKLRLEIVDYLNNHPIRLFDKAGRNDISINDPEQMNERRMEERLKGIYSSGSRILYANEFELRHSQKTYTVVYVLEIRKVETQIIGLFYSEPEFSFLRMVLDYFFADFFKFDKDNCLVRNNDSKLQIRYQEDITQFARMSSASIESTHMDNKNRQFSV